MKRPLCPVLAWFLASLASELAGYAGAQVLVFAALGDLDQAYPWAYFQVAVYLIVMAHVALWAARRYEAAVLSAIRGPE